MVTAVTIPTPDDWHCHLREGALMEKVAPLSGVHFKRVVAMPNLSVPITSLELARNYQQALKKACPNMTPLIPFYLQEHSDVQTLLRGFAEGLFFSVKYYPRGATTQSHLGVHDWQNCRHIFAAMQEADIPLMIHGEVTDSDVDMFERESVFVTQILQPLLKAFPSLRVVLEHLTTKDAVTFIETADHNIAATITPHHLTLTRTDLLSGGLHPDYFCYPVVKTAQDQQALRKAATSGNPRFMLGTDSAPHPHSQKYQKNGKAGIFSSPTALAIYAQVFAQEHALDKLAGFASLHGSAFHNLKPHDTTITLKQHETPQQVADVTFTDPSLSESLQTIRVFHPPHGLFWS